MTKDLVRTQFGAHAEAYAASAVHAKGASLARLVELAAPQPEWRVLDIATAAGHTAFAFAPHVAHVVATDITPEMLPVAAKLAAEKGVDNVTLEVADAEDLPFADAQFDLITCRIAPHHFPHIDRFLAQAARVLRSGGILAVVDNVVPRGDAGEYVNRFEKLRDPSHHRALSLDEWSVAFAAAGFQAVHTEAAFKKMEFQPWAERMGASAETIAELRGLLQDAPTDAAAYLQPVVVDGVVIFYLSEAILIGHKPEWTP